MTVLYLVLAWFGLLMMLAHQVEAATLRSMTILHAPIVRLSDLFDSAGPQADRVLGPAPGPGGRIVVEAAQLGAIARQFGVDWRPVSAGDRAVLERPGRILAREEVLSAVKTALVAAGASPDCLIDLPGFNPPLVPIEADAHPVATQLDYDTASGRFAAILSITGDGMEPLNMRIAGHADDTIELPVATTRLPRGTVLRAEDVHVTRVRVALEHGEVAHDIADAVGMQVRHAVAPGQPLALADLMRPSMVQRGSIVRMQLESAGLSVVAQGIAQEAGAAGERIHVLNPSSRAIVEAEIIGPGRVRVTPGVSPITIAARPGLALAQ